MRQAVALALAMTAVAALVFASGSATADPSISSKRQQAQAILTQVQDLDSSLSHAIESYNLANIQLTSIDADLKSNGQHLVIAKQSLGIAQTHIAKRLRALYINGDSGGAVDVILGAKSLDDLLDRLDMAQRVGGQDARVLTEMRRFRGEVETRRQKLSNDRDRQAQVVSQRASQKQWIESKLSERRQLLSSIQGEIKRMEQAEARRQAILAAQARARLAATRSEASQPQALQYSPPRRGLVDTLGAGAVLAVRRGGRDRDAVPGDALRLGRREPRGLRLLGLRDVRLRADGRVAATQRGDAVQHRRDVRPARPAAAGRPRLLRRPRPHGHLHRRRAVHPRPAHG